MFKKLEIIFIIQTLKITIMIRVLKLKMFKKMVYLWDLECLLLAITKSVKIRLIYRVRMIKMIKIRIKKVNLKLLNIRNLKVLISIYLIRLN